MRSVPRVSLSNSLAGFVPSTLLLVLEQGSGSETTLLYALQVMVAKLPGCSASMVSALHSLSGSIKVQNHIS